MWHDITTEFPANLTFCWVRRFWFSKAFQATFRTATMDFLLDNGSTIPWYFISRWRAV